jgi:MerR family copper efflux transcriptional regulator
MAERDRVENRIYQIGEVADRVGLSLRTLRHWDEVGLVRPSGRSTGGFRLYTDSDVELLMLAKAMKPLDFSLDEMRELLGLRVVLSEPGVGADVRDAAAERLAMFTAVADERCARLAEQLAGARSLADALRAEWGTTPADRPADDRDLTPDA